MPDPPTDVAEGGAAATESMAIDDGTSGKEAEVVDEAPSNHTTPDKEDDNTINDGVQNYDELIEANTQQEEKEIDEAISEAANELRDSSDAAEVLVGTSYTKERLEEMKSMYVVNPEGIEQHKLAVLKSINKGKSVVKSFDRTRRVRDEPRKGYTTTGKIDSVVTRAFKFAHGSSRCAKIGLLEMNNSI